MSASAMKYSSPQLQLGRCICFSQVRRLWRIVGLMLISLLTTVFYVIPAEALHLSVTHNTVNVTTTRWAAVATAQGQPATTGPLQMNWSVNQGVAYQYFDVVNVGSVALTSQSFMVTNTYDKSGNVKPPAVTFEACTNGAWTSTTNTCSGSVLLLGTTNTEFFVSLSTPLTVNQRLSVRARTSPGASSSYMTTVSIYVGRTNLRPATLTNM